MMYHALQRAGGRRRNEMRTILITMVAAGAVGVVCMSSTMAAPENGAALIRAAQATSLVQDVRTIVVHRCKINGRWRPCRCPASEEHVNCVHWHSEKFRHAGHCKGPG